MRQVFKEWPRRTILLGTFLLGVMIGILSSYMVPGVSVWVAAVLGLVTLGLSFWKPILIIISAFALGCVPGLLRGEYFLVQIAQYEPLIGEQITVFGVIADDVGANEKRETEFHITEVRLEDGRKLSGKIRIRTRDSLDLGRGDVVQARGKLYETLGTARQASMTFAEIKLLAENTSVIEQWRVQFFATVSQIISDPKQA